MSELPGAVGLLGGGVIGGGWAARFVLSGVNVSLYDPAPGAERRVLEMVENARRAHRSLTMVPLPPEGELRFVGSVEEAVGDAEFVQESAPERLEIKRELLRAASQAAREDAVIASSTSGIRPSLMQEPVERPGRLVVGHPFNPVYLIPLVEVCGGEQTDAQALGRAAAVYRALGMHPLHVRREIDGFVADRLLEALWREALWLVHDDVATAAEIDDAIRYGAGLRWSFMGTFLTYRIAGGEAGMRHFLSQFGPALKAPWSKLMDVPELTPELVEKLAEQSDAQVGDVDPAELERWRDDCLVAVLQGLRGAGAGAGVTVARWEQGLLGAAGAPGARAEPLDEAPLRLVAQEIPPGWIDYNDHVHESRYLQLFADATDAVLRLIGVDSAYVAGTGSFYTVETHLSHLGQAFAGDRVLVETQVLGFDGKRLHLFHRLLRDGESELAVAEQMLLHVVDGSVSAADRRVGERAAEVAHAHAGLPRPSRAGRSIAAVGRPV